MQTPAQQLDHAFRKAIRAAFNIDADPIITISQNPAFGDYQSNAAMGLAKRLSKETGQKANPRQIAEQIIAQLDLAAIAQQTSIAGPGFINIRLAPAFLADSLNTIRGDDRLGVERAAAVQRVVVDYSGPNIAKEMHVGHLRSTIIGDAISRVLDFEGHEVIRQNHIGDWGTQFGMLIQFMVEQATRIGTLSDLEGFYRSAKERFDADPNFAAHARDVVIRLQAGDEHVNNLWQIICIESRNHYQAIYERLGVKLLPKDERGESAYNADLPAVVQELLEKNIAEKSEGAIVVKTPGFEAPLMIEKTGGGYLYATTDLAAIRFRTGTLQAQRIIYTHDSRQAQHFAQVFAAAKRAGWAEGVSLEFAPFGTMLGDDGKPFKTRSGGTVKLKELLDEAEQRAFDLVSAKNPEFPAEQRRSIAHAVGIGAVKYSDLAKDRISDYVFSWDKMLAMDGNTAPYLQYAYARIRSIFRKAGDRAATGPIAIESPFEAALARHILRLGEVIEQVDRELKPHILCTYLYELAVHFSAFYENCPVLQSAEPARSSRLSLCAVTSDTMALGLNLLGIDHPDQL